MYAGAVGPRLFPILPDPVLKAEERLTPCQGLPLRERERESEKREQGHKVLCGKAVHTLMCVHTPYNPHT